MATKAELEAKIVKAKANKMMPDALKKQYIDKIQKEIDALPGEKAAAKKAAPAEKEHQRYKIKWFNSKAKPQRIEEIVFDGEDAYEKAVAWGKKNLERFNTDVIQRTTDYRSVAQMTEKPAKKASKKTMEKAFGKEFMESKDKGSLKTYPADKGHGAKWTASYKDYYENVIIAMEESGEMTTSDAQGVADPHEDWLKQKHNDGVLPGAAAVLLLRKSESKDEGSAKQPKGKYKVGDFVNEDLPYVDKESLAWKVNKVEYDEKKKKHKYHVSHTVSYKSPKEDIVNKKTFWEDEIILKGSRTGPKGSAKKAEPAKPAGKKGVDYDCDELIEKEKARKASAKKSAAKSPAKKSGDAIEKTTDAIEKKAEDGDLTKDQILALIQKFKKEIRRLEKLLKTAK